LISLLHAQSILIFVSCKNSYNTGIIRQGSLVSTLGYTSLQRLYVKLISTSKPDSFKQWLVGFIDGDGTFTIDRQNNGTKWNLVLKISQNKTNGQVLHYMKKKLGVGHITESNGNLSFIIRNRVHLQIIIFPIFDAFPLVTVKYFDYLLVKQAAEVLSSNLTRAEINSRLEELYNSLLKGPAKDFKSIVWSGVDLQNITAAHKSILANYWLVGFWEAEGSFYIVNKAPGRFAHGLVLTQKHDRQILEVIRLIFGAAAKVKDRRPLQDYYIWDSTSKSVIQSAILFFNTYPPFGRLSLKFSVWRRSCNYSGVKLLEARKLLRKLN
jgi:hypothetical protein